MANREITNIKTGAVSTVTEEEWETIVKAGWKGKYRVKIAPMGAKKPPFIPLEVKEMKKPTQENDSKELPKQNNNETIQTK